MGQVNVPDVLKFFTRGNGELFVRMISTMMLPMLYAGKPEYVYDAKQQRGLMDENASVLTGSTFGRGNLSNIINSTFCTGQEWDLSACKSSPWQESSCNGTDVATVNCKALIKTDVRLFGGRTPNTGRLEVKHDGEWGTVCDDEFDNASAKVVCKMIGFTDDRHARFIPASVYGPGAGTIWLDDIKCFGNETDISDCQHSEWGKSDCNHDEDISVDCQTPTRLFGGNAHKGRVEVQIDGEWNSLCKDTFRTAEAKVVCSMLGFKTPIRLANGTGPHSGRVELKYRGQWGTICDDNFDDMEAKVICNMLGFSGKSVFLLNAKAHFGAYYGEGQGNIVVDELRCVGTEEDISECKSSDWLSQTDCNHNEDAAVECCKSFYIEIGEDGPADFVGRLEILNGTNWETVCSDGVDNHTALVICNTLGFQRG
ncbi:DMBT1-like protein [Mya arenaria]|uniref:DMBT1-like protein n=1 Tax=Mya arenaria TaxID=6604 RepID=A0ABY7DCF9_MYAAR|nr:DMBT1-like protein [Mya arenaria]